jgi:DNA-directed RNA polymerase specialized sigma24 family protein/ribosome-associated translation inhibitor RaiA
MNARFAAAAEGSEQLVFKQFPDNLKDQARKLWERRQKKLERLLEHFPSDQRHLRVVFDENQHHKRLYDVHAVLTLPTGTLVAEAQAYDPKLIDAVDRVADQLENEIIRHKALLRHDYLYKRKRRRWEDSAGIRPALESYHREHQREQFVELLRSPLRDIEAHARRELAMAQLEGIRPDELTVSDLLDQVAVRAWDRFEDWPAARPLEQWLTQILHEVLDEKRVESPPAASIHDKIAGDDPLAQLASYPREKRRAFTLHELEGWDIVDIASVLGRSSEQVRADIDAVRQGLGERLGKLEEPSRQSDDQKRPES